MTNPVSEAEAPEADDEAVEEETDEPYVKPDGSPFTAADYAKLTGTVKNARLREREAKAELAEAGKPKPRVKPKAEDSEAEVVDPEKLTADARDAEAKAWKPRVVKAQARAEFASAGLVLPKKDDGTAMARVLRMLDLDELEVGEDGRVEGLAEQVEEIKAEFPEMFASARRPGGIDAAGRTGPGQKSKTSSDQLAAQLLGR